MVTCLPATHTREVADHVDVVVKQDKNDWVNGGVRPCDERQQFVDLLGLSKHWVNQSKDKERIPTQHEQYCDDEQDTGPTERVSDHPPDVSTVYDVALRDRDGRPHQCGESMRRVRLDVAIEEHEVVNSPNHGQCHDDDPHGMDHVALDGAIDKDAVANQIVVVEVSPNDGWSEVNDDAAKIHHEDAKRDAAETAATFTPDIVFAECVGFAAHHRNDVEAGCSYYHYIGSTKYSAEAGCDIS